ncbi:MAG: hypothetical protein IJI10_02545 [Eubacterium sp.]|nr:hypothetical protein [Eubacterium sp.]
MRERKSYILIVGRVIGYVILLLCLFPLGFWLLLRKLRRECGKGGRTAHIVLIAGCVLCGLALLCFAGILHEGIDPMGHFVDIAAFLLILGTQGCCFLCTGLFYLCQEREIRRYRALLRDRSSCDVDEACAELKTGRKQMFTDMILLMEEGFLEDYYISYDRQQIMRKDSEEASVRYCSTCGRAVILDNSRITVCPDCGGLPVMQMPAEPETGTVKQTGSVIRKSLWITGAALSALAGYFLWPLCLLLTAAACIMELRRERPDYRLIHSCGTGMLLYGLVLFFCEGVFFIRDQLPDPGAAQFLNYLLVCFLLFPCFYILSAVFRQRFAHIRMCREIERDLHPETPDDICRYTGLGSREAGAARKILGQKNKQPGRAYRQR